MEVVFCLTVFKFLHYLNYYGTSPGLGRLIMKEKKPNEEYLQQDVECSSLENLEFKKL